MTLLFKNVQVVDGSGSKIKTGDVLVKNKRISAIGSLNKSGIDRVIEGRGAYCAPGFINVNSDSDHYLTLFDNPEQQDLVLQGVTTIIGGLCGASLAPLLYGSLESIRKWVNPDRVNVDWHTLEEFLKVLERRPLSLNFGTLVGHSTIRRALIGETLRDLTENEIKVFMSLLERAFHEGAFGLSVGLGYAHARQTPYSELRELARIVKKYNGVYATHLRNEEEGLFASMHETMNLVSETGVKALISHFRPLVGFEDEWQKSFDILDESSKTNMVRADVYPFEQSLVPIYTLLPRWAQNGGLQLMLNHIRIGAIKERIIKALPELNAAEIIIATAPGNEYLVHKTLKDFCKTRAIKSHEEGLVELMNVVNLKALVLVKNINSTLVLKNIAKKSLWIGSNSASFKHDIEVVKPDRALRTFPFFLKYAEEKKGIALEALIKKMTSEPAKAFGIEGRGLIKEGMYADIVLFGGGVVRYVVVNGEVVVEDGNYASKFSGMILRKNTP